MALGIAAGALRIGSMLGKSGGVLKKAVLKRTKVKRENIARRNLLNKRIVERRKRRKTQWADIARKEEDCQ